MENLTLRAYLKQCEREYWERLAEICHDRDRAFKIAGVSQSTFYRSRGHAFARATPLEPPDDDYSVIPIGKVRRMPAPRHILPKYIGPMPLVLMPWRRRKYYGVWTLFNYFGVHMPRDKWTATRKKKSVKEYELLYEHCHRHYRIWMRRCHPDVAKQSKVDPMTINQLWTKLKAVLRREMAALGAEL